MDIEIYGNDTNHTKIVCDCGIRYMDTLDARAKHFRCKTHQQWLETGIGRNPPKVDERYPTSDFRRYRPSRNRAVCKYVSRVRREQREEDYIRVMQEMIEEGLQ